MSPAVDRNPPPFIQIARSLREGILRGQPPTGERLPSVKEIAKEYQVATATAAKAIGMLKAEGYVVTSSQGTVAAKPKTHTAGSDRYRLLATTGTGLADDETVEVVSSGLEPAAEALRNLLSLDDDEAVLARRRVYSDSVGVSTVSTSYLAGHLAEIAPELLDTAPLPNMTRGLVEDRTGRRASRQRDKYVAASVPADVATLLGVDAGTVTLAIINTYWDQDGVVIEHAVDFLNVGRERAYDFDL